MILSSPSDTGRPYGRTTRRSTDGRSPRHVAASRRPSVITASDDYFNNNFLMTAVCCIVENSVA